ncbi:DUF6642 family protein [Flavobacterium sp. I3-2]|uniref:DUF6642 family protein n=1 Tax=Flavobacterium sp. I3-2 TaxID=2748319 RepID=UPI0015A9C1FE|nr:DUF6642 family protein [Flavobacterium sp. I3-2]
MNFAEESYKLYCLQNTSELEENPELNVFFMLEKLTLNFGITNVYKNFDSIESFQESLETLVYTDRNFKEYELIYLILSGKNGTIEIDGYLYSFEEIAEVFQGKLNNKILHFANTKDLNLDEETAQYFLDITGAKAISGYTNNSPIFSNILDYHYFKLYQVYDNIFELIEKLFEQQYALCTNMGFRLYY